MNRKAGAAADTPGTEQGCQFTGAPFTGMLEAHEVRISVGAAGGSSSQRRSGGVNPRYGKSLSRRSFRATVGGESPFP